MEKRPVAVFDLDGTLFRSSLFLELVEHLVLTGVLPKEVHAQYEKELADWLDRKGDYGTFIMKAVDAFRTNIKGVPYEAVKQAADEVIAEKKYRVYRYTRDLVRDLKRKGYYLLAISHSPRFVVQSFGSEAGFDKTYGFFYEVGPTERFTGAVEDEDLMRNKAAILERAVRKENLTLTGSIGVGDTESDIPMLELVENPIAFNPNNGLYEHARRRQWKVIVERKDVIYEI